MSNFDALVRGPVSRLTGVQPDPAQSTGVPAQAQEALAGGLPAALSSAVTSANPFASISQSIFELTKSGGPMAFEMARGLAEQSISDSLGYRMHLPTIAEMAQDSQRLLQSAFNAQRQESALRVQNLVGFLIDNPSTALSEIVPGGPSNVTLEGVLGRLDQTLLQDPDRLIDVSKRLAGTLNEPSLALKPSDLFNFAAVSEGPLASAIGAAATKTTEERGADRARQTAGALRANEEVAERLAETGEFEGALGRDLESALESRGEAQGLDLTPGFFGSDLDTAAGAAAGRRAVLDRAEAAGRIGIDRGTFLLAVVRGELGGPIVDVLEDLPFDPGSGLVGIDATADDSDRGAAAEWLSFVQDVARENSLSVSQVFSLIGLPYRDIDPLSLSQALEVPRETPGGE